MNRLTQKPRRAVVRSTTLALLEEIAKPDARPVPVLYTFTCGGAKVPCRLTYTYESDLHKGRKLPAPK